MGIRYNLDRDKMQCIECGQDIAIYDKAHSIYFGCEACGAFFQQEQGKPTGKIHKLSKGSTYNFILPIGAEATISKKTFTVSGRLHKRDMGDYDLEWAEYLLYSTDTDNYFTLAEVNGNWWLVWPEEIKRYTITNRGTDLNPDLAIKKKNAGSGFDKYADYLFETLAAEGEFDWDVADESGKNKVTEYMKGDELLVSEVMDGETKWYTGRKVEKREISRVFGLPISTLLALKRYPDEDEPGYVRKWPAMKTFTLWSLLIAMAVCVLSWMMNPAKTVYTGKYYTSRDTGAGALTNMALITTDTFVITKAGAVDIEMEVPLDNEWMELGVEMVNEQTGATYTFSKELSYYHGYEGGESWSEGGNSDNGVLSQVVPGTYRLILSPYSTIDRTFDIGIKVEQNTGLTSNIVLLFLLLLAWPCVQYSAVYNYYNEEE